MGEKMTGKPFNYHIDEVGVYYYVCDNTKKGDDKIIFEFNTKFDAMEVCELLNELHEENERLRKAVDNCQFRTLDLLDYIKEKETITHQEIKEWWNSKVIE